MSDYASILGGAPVEFIGKTVGLDQVASNWDAYYHIESENIFLERFDSSGDAIVDAVDNLNAVRIELGSGTDVVNTGAGDDTIRTESGDDVVDAGQGDNTISGAAGRDTVLSGGGDDELSGGSGADSLVAGAGDDYVSGGSGADSLQGAAGDDTVLGGSGADSLYGMAGDDLLVGDGGADLLMGGAGADSLFGGSGRDVFAFDDGFGRDVISDFRPGDQINLASNLNGTGIGSAEDLVRLNMVSGGTTDAGTKFTLITIGNDTIRLENTDSADFIDQINSWVKVG